MKIVFSPPNRSEITPQTCRLAKAVPSRTDSTRAPVARLKPRSPQNATICCCGMAIGTQQSTPPRHISTKARLAGKAIAERGARGRVGAAACRCAAGLAGGGLRNTSASGTTNAITNAPYMSIVVRQPKALIERSNTGGHSAPAR